MKLFPLLLVLALSAVAQTNTPTNAQDRPAPPAIPDNASARAVLQACSLAMGGNVVSASLHLQGARASQGSAPSPVQIDIEGTDRFREQWTSNDFTQVTTIFDQRRKTTRSDRPDTADIGSEPYFLPDSFPAAMCAISQLAPSAKPVLIADEIVNGRPVLHLQLVVQRQFKEAKLNRLHAILSERHLWIDKQTFLVIKTSRRVFSSDTINNSSLWEVAYSDYRQVGRYMVPFAVQMSLDGSVVELYTITEGAVGAKLQEEGQ